jgi:hypothetical protein
MHTSVFARLAWYPAVRFTFSSAMTADDAAEPYRDVWGHVERL